MSVNLLLHFGIFRFDLKCLVLIGNAGCYFKHFGVEGMLLDLNYLL